jgi:Mn2+/Fe2+ NRAMP family transporter
VTLCLLRACAARGSAGGARLCLGLLCAQGFADLFSFGLLRAVLAQPAPPAALAFGLWLTAAGIGAFTGVGAAGGLAIARDRTKGLGRRIVGLLGGIYCTCIAAWVAAVLLYATPAVLWFGAPCPSWVSWVPH